MKQTFGQLLRQLRKSRGITLRALATKTGLSFSYISKIENGRIPPPAANTIVKICNILETPPDELLMLAGKVPPTLFNHFGSSKSALEFARHTRSMGLTEEEWGQLTHELKRLRSRTLAELQVGDHICCIYETEEEYKALLTTFLRLGLEQGEKILYITDAHPAEAILSYLREDRLEVELYLTKGQLNISNADGVYLRGGVFDPDAMIALLRSETERAMAEGYRALRISGEMSWALRGQPGSERLPEYETKLHSFFTGSQCVGMCQYDRRRFDPTLLLNLLITHPTVVLGTEIYNNPGYIPLEQWHSSRHSPTMVYHALERLLRNGRVGDIGHESGLK